MVVWKGSVDICKKRDDLTTELFKQVFSADTRDTVTAIDSNFKRFLQMDISNNLLEVRSERIGL